MNPAEEFDPLVSFLHWWLAVPRTGLFPSIHAGVSHVGPYTGIILYRRGPFQVQLWIVPPNVESPVHSHPHADIFLVHVTGDIRLWVADGAGVLQPVLTGEMTVADELDRCKVNGNFHRLRPGVMHKAASGPLGGAFMDVQLWIDGNPRSTEEDWDGDRIDADHQKKIAEADARLYGKLQKQNCRSYSTVAGDTSRKGQGTGASPVGLTQPPSLSA